MPTVLIVCLANMCRSPMAMALLRRRLADAGVSGDWRVESAGTWAREGAPAAAGAQHDLAARGLDLSAHRSRAVSAELLREFDLILTMTRSQQEALQVEFKDVRDRVHLLAAMAGASYDVPDPIGGPLSAFRASAREIDTLIAHGFDKIVKLATANEARRST